LVEQEKEGVFAMRGRLIGVLLVIAGLVTLLHKEAMGPKDWAVLLAFLLSGAVVLLFSFRKQSEEAQLYRVTVELEGIPLKDSQGQDLLTPGQQLFVRPYQGAQKQEIHIYTEDGVFLAPLPQEQVQHVQFQLERHSPIHLTVKALEPSGDGQTQRLQVELLA